MRTLTGIKPQDILILLKLSEWKDRPHWRSSDLARELELSPFEISVGLGRCRRSGFLDASKRELMRSALLEFILHGLKYVYPVQPGPLCRGIPTAHSAPPLAGKIVSQESDAYVWPDESGDRRGQAIEPLYESAPRAAKKDARLYELLALVDAIRVGHARERALAAEELGKRLA